MVHPTHQLFLRESCPSVLLVSAREKEKATERAEYWLEHVKSFGKSAPVLIVANKADKEPVRLDENLLMEKYPCMIGGFFQLSCTDTSSKFRSRFEEFHSVFCQQLQQVGLHQVQFMKPHFAVLQNLRERTPSQAFLTHADYKTLCDAQQVDAHGALDRNWLLDILDKLGVIGYFPDMIEMDKYILNPRWLTYGVYTLMYNEHASPVRKRWPCWRPSLLRINMATNSATRRANAASYLKSCASTSCAIFCTTTRTRIKIKSSSPPCCLPPSSNTALIAPEHWNSITSSRAFCRAI
jgi:C-terminal of Roc, COR, domain